MVIPQGIKSNKKGKLKPAFTNTVVTYKIQELLTFTGNVKPNN
jgi:hypothetical protein